MDDRSPVELSTTTPAEGLQNNVKEQARKLPAASAVASELPSWEAVVFSHVARPLTVEFAVFGPAGAKHSFGQLFWLAGNSDGTKPNGGWQEGGKGPQVI